MFAEQSELEEKQENSGYHHSDQQDSLPQQQAGAQSKSGHYASQIESDFLSEEKCGQDSLLQQQAGAQSKSGHYASQTESDFGTEEKCGQNSLSQQQVSAQSKSGHYAWWNPLYWIAVGIIRFYRKFISPMKAPCCRFLPTCSEYALEAFHRHGFFKGLFLSVRRIFRCNPFGKGGFDPVPSDFHIFKKRK